MKTTAVTSLVGILAIVFLNGACTPRSQATIQEARETIKTYPFGEPDPVPILTRSNDLWGRAARLYPYSFIDEFSREGEDREWTVVRLENPYITVAVLPEVGGSIWGASEKSTGLEFIYTNKVLKFREIALRGPWTSGGIEFNFGIVGHTPSGAHPVDYVVRSNPDGSVSCVVGNLDLPSRTRWSVAVTVPPDKAYFETRSLWYNPSSFRQSYYVWMNGAIRVSEDLQYIFPGTSQIGHNFNVPLRPWPEDEQGRDLSWYRNNAFGSYKSYFTIGEYADFFGGYWHDAGFGFGHWARYDDVPGQKIWIWGLSRQGMIWEELLTDSDGQYSEPQAGRLFNQEDHGFFPPGSGDRWRELWFPYKDIGPMVAAFPRAVLSLEKEGQQIKLGVCPLQALDDDLVISREGREIYREHLDVRPMETVIRDIDPGDGTGWLQVRIGDKLVYTDDPSAAILQRPIRFQDYAEDSIEGRFRAAERMMQERDTVQALPKYLEILEIETLHTKALCRVAELYTRRGEYDRALPFAERALGNAMYDPDANFTYGVIARRMGRLVDAKETFGWAARSLQYRSAAYTQMAEIYLLERDHASALEYGKRAVEYDTHNLDALQIQAIALHRSGSQPAAEEILEHILTFDPLNHIVRFELYKLDPSEARLSDFRSMIRNEYAHETLMEMALYYLRLGLEEETAALFGMAGARPVADYWLAYLLREESREQSEALLRRASRASARGVFPFREETIPVLEWVRGQDPEGWKPRYYLALLLWSKGRVEEAQVLLEACGEPDFAPLYHARAFFDRKRNPDRALAMYVKATKVEPGQRRNWFRLLEFCNLNDMYGLALRSARDALREFPDYVPIQVELVRALMGEGEYLEAAEVLDALHVLPSEGAMGVRELFMQAHVQLGLNTIRTGALETAVSHLEKSMEYPERLGSGRPYDPDQRMQQYLIALCHLARGDRDTADKLFNAIRDYSESQAHPEGPHVYFGGLVYRRMGETAKAREWLGRADKPADAVMESLRLLER